MPVNSKHPQYMAYEHQWTKCRDAYEGSDAIKAKNSAYLPRLTDQPSDEYNAYKDRALFYSITSKTIESLVGLAMQKEPILKFPEEMQRYFRENSGVEFYELLKSSFSETLLMGRFGVLIDRHIAGGPAKPVPYNSESILNWELNDQGLFNLIVLHERILQQEPNDRYVKKYYDQYRVLELVDGVYTQSVYNSKLELVNTIQPVNTGITMDFIPFFIVTPSGISSVVDKSPMADIVEVNISHYRTSADLEHGRHFTGLPTPVVIGVDASTVLKIGSMTAWVIPNDKGDAKYLEFTGEGLKSLEKALSEKQSQLASMSARLIDTSTRGSESPETVKLRYASENANLVSISRSVEAFLNMIYKTIASMESLNDNEVRIDLNKEFISKSLTSKEVKELVEAYFEGGISKETLIYNLRKGGVISPLRSDTEESSAIFEAKPVTTVNNQGA